MDLDILLKELVDIASFKIEPKEATYLSEVDLEPKIIYRGCIKIVTWLWNQSEALRLDPLELNLFSEMDVACINVVEKSNALQAIVQIREGKIMFNENVTEGDAIKMMVYAKENYKPHVRLN